MMMFETGYLKKSSRFVIGGLNKYFLKKGHLYNSKGVSRSSRFLFVYPVTLRFVEKGVVSKSEVESVKKFLVRKLKKNFVIHCTSWYPVSKKPSGVRMGKGKGSKAVDYFVGVRSGQNFVSVYRLDKKRNLGYVKKCLFFVGSKLSVSTKVFLYDGCGLKGM